MLIDYAPAVQAAPHFAARVRPALEWSLARLDLYADPPAVQADAGCSGYCPESHAVKLGIDMLYGHPHYIEHIIFHEAAHAHQYRAGMLRTKPVAAGTQRLVLRLLFPDWRDPEMDIDTWRCPATGREIRFLSVNEQAEGHGAAERWYRHGGADGLIGVLESLGRAPVCDGDSPAYDAEYDALPWESHANALADEMFRDWSRLDWGRRARRLTGGLRRFG